MKQFRLEKNVPDIYVNESRDFQLLLRLYTCIFDGLLYSIDTTSSVTDTLHIRDTILPLLSTKLGFFSNLEISSHSLRLILQALPEIQKYKGSLMGIKYVMNLYMKILNEYGSIIISLSNASAGEQAYIIQIGSDVNFTDIPLLNALLELVLPAGFGVEYYHLASIGDTITELEYSQNTTILGKMIAATSSILRTSNTDYTQVDAEDQSVPSTSDSNILQIKNKLFGSVGIAELVGSKDTIKEFSNLLSYSVGDVVYYIDNNEKCYYQCIEAITTPGDWDSSKWAQLTYYV